LRRGRPYGPLRRKGWRPCDRNGRRPHAQLDTQKIVDQLEKATLNPGAVAQNVGNVDSAMARRSPKDRGDLPGAVPRARDHGADELHPFMSQGRLRNRVGNQALATRPGPVAAKTAGLPLDKVVVHNHLIGGGFRTRLRGSMA